MIVSSHPTFHPKKILVPMDFSPSSVSAVTTAAELAQQFHAELYLLHVVPMLPVVSGIEFPTPLYPEHEYLADAVKESEKRLADFVGNLSGQGIRASSKVEIGNDVVGNILMVLDREDADLLVISTHGISGWRPLIFGSIADQVIKLVQCPILLLRSVKIADEIAHKDAK